MGNPDLTPEAGREHPSLAALIAAGDADALAGFRDAHAGKVRSYCTVVCAGERVEEAVAASFAEFAARVQTEAEKRDARLEELLLQATRSSAAGRFEVWRPLSDVERSGPKLRPECAAMPELLAAAANDELRRAGERLRDHLVRCETCGTTAMRMREAEQAFVHAPAGAV